MGETFRTKFLWRKRDQEQMTFYKDSDLNISQEKCADKTDEYVELKVQQALHIGGHQSNFNPQHHPCAP